MIRSALLLVVAMLVACSPAEGTTVEVRDARIGEPAGAHAALYLTARASGSDRLVGASTPVAREVQIHSTVIGDDGTVSMVPEEGIDLRSGEELVLEPGGSHIMLLDVDSLQAGDEVTVELEFERSGTVEVTAEVVALSEVLE